MRLQPDSVTYQFRACSLPLVAAVCVSYEVRWLQGLSCCFCLVSVKATASSVLVSIGFL